ncbi:heme ABC transporter ATP-binding protein [Rhizobium alvei]|uniref:Heme ABC transporter ATP-binding protein n=1 Tax=Rhizobium alvei TaxID=1132659 RepID=A0ABT8YFB9_9HYPH|nr:heme ABC transporter ATP-binding protein [Rhizobium alvei]MDO6962411.1 heme ABC transporter ATP-binding protein [Rhizobium alvei]
MIELENVSVTLAGRSVVSGLTFQAEPGKLTAVIGPNGSGKTSSLRAISGERSYSGRISLSGRDLASFSPKELARERGVLAQSTSLGFPFRVREILEMGIVAGEVHSRNEADRIMDEALEAVDLNGFGDRIATQLSGGEQARMHMARLLCQIASSTHDGRARWLLLDEPVASLDVKHQLAIMTLARAFVQRGGGVIAVMHDLNLTAMFADHVVMMKAGRLHAAGSPALVLAEDNLETVYGCRLSVSFGDDGMPRILPQLAG